MKGWKKSSATIAVLTVDKCRFHWKSEDQKTSLKITFCTQNDSSFDVFYSRFPKSAKIMHKSSQTRRLRLKSVWSITQHGEILLESFLTRFKKKHFFLVMLSLDVELGGGGTQHTQKNQKRSKWPKNDPGWFSPCWVPPPTQHVYIQTCTYRLMVIALRDHTLENEKAVFVAKMRKKGQNEAKTVKMMQNALIIRTLRPLTFVFHNDPFQSWPPASWPIRVWDWTEQNRTKTRVLTGKDSVCFEVKKTCKKILEQI